MAALVAVKRAVRAVARLLARVAVKVKTARIMMMTGVGRMDNIVSGTLFRLILLHRN